jgi:ATP-binding cassette subfamily F protein 3
MRIALARLLVQRPTLLLLDEPTNHLDLPARDWLEAYLKAYPHTVILVSHDRWFLENVVGCIVEIWNGGLTEYPGTYSRYEAERDRRVAALYEAKTRQDEEIARTQAFIDRFRYQATKAAQVQSRVKQLERIERINVPPARRQVHFRFPAPPPCGQLPLRLEGVEHGYGDLSVLAGVDLVVQRGERVALVGPNGAGKSTLMRVLSGAEAPRAGRRFEGTGLRIAYFAQDQAKVLRADRTVLEEILDAAPLDVAGKVRDILGTFLFSGDDVQKRVSVLSGGERNRLAMAILLLRPANLLLLDEPTNHLDLRSKDVLLEALGRFPGTIVFVSHDRHFVDHLATRILEIGGGRVVSWPGNYEAFLQVKARVGDDSHQEKRVEHRLSPAPGAPQEIGDGKRAYEQRKEAQKALIRRERRLAEAQERIETRETELREVEAAMADPALYQDAARWREVDGRRTVLVDEVAAAWAAWEAIEAEP